jgi:hypothetical protein
MVSQWMGKMNDWAYVNKINQGTKAVTKGKEGKTANPKELEVPR